MRRFRANVVLVLLLAAAGCRTASDEHEADTGTSGEPAATDHAASGHTAAAEGGQALLPIMQRLGGEMTTLTYALMTDDYDGVTRSAAAIAEHAPISPEELERV